MDRAGRNYWWGLEKIFCLAEFDLEWSSKVLLALHTQHERVCPCLREHEGAKSERESGPLSGIIQRNIARFIWSDQNTALRSYELWKNAEIPGAGFTIDQKTYRPNGLCEVSHLNFHARNKAIETENRGLTANLGSHRLANYTMTNFRKRHWSRRSLNQEEELINRLGRLSTHSHPIEFYAVLCKANYQYRGYHCCPHGHHRNTTGDTLERNNSSVTNRLGLRYGKAKNYPSA